VFPHVYLSHNRFDFSTQVRSFATGTSCVTDVALASTGALVSRAAAISIPSSSHATIQAKLQEKDWKGLASRAPGTAEDAAAAFATLVDGLSGCAWSYESEAK
jgi:hypothetical protein